MSARSLIREVPGLLITGARYMLAERMAHKVYDGQPVAGDLALFVVADIADGAVLRAFNADTPLRRIADGVVDHASEVRVAYETAKKYPAARAYLGILATRAAIVGGVNALHLMKTGEVTKGQNAQRSTNLATAAFGLIALTGNKPATHIAGVIASGIAIATAIPHMKGIGQRHEGGVRKI